ncbi:MAG TPA: hypothetical protein PKA42_01485 [Candidatus Paceibacterota bacterium]|nr:hypothetical protein [Candidatus Paceibacterota bacterium]
MKLSNLLTNYIAVPLWFILTPLLFTAYFAISIESTQITLSLLAYSLLSFYLFYKKQETWLDALTSLKQFRLIKTLTEQLFFTCLILLSIINFAFVSILNTQSELFYNLNLAFTIAASLSGFIVFWLNWKGLEKAKVKDQSSTQTVYISLLFIITILGFLIRIWNTDKLGIWVEEQFAAVAGYNMLQFGLPIFEDSLYYRAFLYTVLNSLVFSTFGFDILQMRLLPIAISTAIIPLIFFVLKSVLPIRWAVLGSFIFAASDFALMYANYNRFYIGLSLLFLLLSFSLYQYYFNYRRGFFYLALFIAFILPGFDINSVIYLPVAGLTLLILNKDILKDFTFWIFNLCGLLGFFLFRYLEGLGNKSYINEEVVSQKIGQGDNIFNALFAYLTAFKTNDWDFYFINFFHEFFPFLLISLVCTAALLFVRFRTLEKTHLILSNFLVLFITLIIIFYSVYSVDRLNFHWDQRHISFLFPLLICNFIFFIYFLSQLIKNQSQRYLIIILITLSLINPLEIYRVKNIDYGSDLTGTRHNLMKAEPYRADYTTVYNYVASEYMEGDIIISDNFLKLPTHRTANFKLSFDDNIERINQILSQNERVWIIDVTYDMNKWHARFRYGQIYKFLESNTDNLVYYSQDGKSRVYLFTHPTITLPDNMI